MRNILLLAAVLIGNSAHAQARTASAIFYGNETERAAAEASKAALLKGGQIKQIYTEIVPAARFYPAEEYHQDYYKKNPLRYRFYRTSCGREARVAEVWGSQH